MPVPTYDNLFTPLLKALHQLGGSASNSEMEEKVAEVLNLTGEEINEIHRGSTTKLSYNLAWARTYLKLYGLLERSARGVWALTPKGKKTESIDKEEVKKYVRGLDYGATISEKDVVEEREIGEERKLWQDQLLEEIMKLSPEAFERLCQRVLRESGLVQVKVTGRSGDGGIDGKGIVRLGGLLTFPIIFQCKRYSGSISARAVRDFRGAMEGRADKGLFITTGTFTYDAKQEAVREGAKPIDLIDGEMLVEKMKELGLGVQIKTEEVVEVDKVWFKDF